MKHSTLAAATELRCFVILAGFFVADILTSHHPTTIAHPPAIKMMLVPSAGNSPLRFGVVYANDVFTPPLNEDRDYMCG
jgi:hypothetical protein